MPTLPTPDVESDLAALLAAALPSDLNNATGDAARNTWPGPVRPTSDVGCEVFVTEFSGTTSIDNDGRYRRMSVQITVRSPSNDYGAGIILARKVHDALDLHAAFTGASGAQYMEIRAQLSGPNPIGPDENDQHVFAEPFEVWFDG